MVRQLRAVNANHSVFDNQDLLTSKQQQSDDKRGTTPTPTSKHQHRLSGLPPSISVDDDDDIEDIDNTDNIDDMRYIHSSPSTEPFQAGQRKRRRREVKHMASELQDQCAVLLEEKLFHQALQLYNHSLTAGLETDAPAYISAPHHLAVVATLTVHPKLTTKSLAPEDHAAADDALKFLRHLVNMTDVKEAGLREAFQFEGAGSRGSRPNRARARKSDSLGDEDMGESGTIRGIYADKSLWKSGEDFWAIVGWAFNCSVKHTARWERWKAWLELMLDVLERDLEAARNGKDECSTEDLQPTLLAQYLSAVGEGRNNKRRIMRAVTADGTSKSVSEFSEIWRQETKPPKRKADDEEQPLKRRKLDLENNEYGDYFDEESDDEGSEERKRRSRSTTARSTRSRRSDTSNKDKPDGENVDSDDDSEAGSTAAQGVEAFGGIESIRLRQRFLVLLTRFSWHARKTSLFIEIDELFDLFTEFIRPLPVAVFQQFVLPTKPYFGNVNYEVGLCDMLFAPLLGTKAAETQITQAEFESMFAPSAAINTTAEDNAKVSLLTEGLLRALWREGQLIGDAQKLKSQVELGIAARSHKVAFDGRKKAGKRAELEEEARSSLHCSSERMRMMVDMIAAG